MKDILVLLARFTCGYRTGEVHIDFWAGFHLEAWCLFNQIQVTICQIKFLQMPWVDIVHPDGCGLQSTEWIFYKLTYSGPYLVRGHARWFVLQYNSLSQVSVLSASGSLTNLWSWCMYLRWHVRIPEGSDAGFGRWVCNPDSSVSKVQQPQYILLCSLHLYR